MASCEKEMIGGCCVCSDERGWQNNKLVYCDGPDCAVAVHQVCYGIRKVPAGEWYCRKCDFESKGIAVSGCELCPSRDGAFKPTESGKWAHVVCALYIPEVSFGSDMTMEPVNISKVPRHRFQQYCHLCKLANQGACIKCVRSACSKYFHVTCCQNVGLLSEEASGVNSVRYIGYCVEHWPYQDLRGMLAPKEAKAMGMLVDLGSDEETAAIAPSPAVTPTDAPPAAEKAAEPSPTPPRSVGSAPKRRNSRESPAVRVTPKAAKGKERKSKGGGETKKDSQKKGRPLGGAKARSRKRKDSSGVGAGGGVVSPASGGVVSPPSGGVVSPSSGGVADRTVVSSPTVELTRSTVASASMAAAAAAAAASASPSLARKPNVAGASPDLRSDVAQTMMSLAAGSTDGDGDADTADVVGGESPLKSDDTAGTRADATAADAVKESGSPKAAEEAMQMDGVESDVDDDVANEAMSPPADDPPADATMDTSEQRSSRPATPQSAAVAASGGSASAHASPRTAPAVHASPLAAPPACAGSGAVAAASDSPASAPATNAARPVDDGGQASAAACAVAVVADLSVQVAPLDGQCPGKPLAGHPEAMQDLLLSTWKLGSAFLRTQAMPLNIASVLEALQEITHENKRMEEHVAELERQRDHLQDVTASLKKPLEAAASAAATATAGGGGGAVAAAASPVASPITTTACSSGGADSVAVAERRDTVLSPAASGKGGGGLTTRRGRWGDRLPPNRFPATTAASSSSAAASPSSNMRSDRRHDGSWGGRSRQQQQQAVAGGGGGGGGGNRPKERYSYQGGDGYHSVHRHSSDSPVAMRGAQQAPITLPHPAMTPSSYSSSSLNTAGPAAAAAAAAAVQQQQQQQQPMPVGFSAVANPQAQAPLPMQFPLPGGGGTGSYAMPPLNPALPPHPLQSPFMTQMQQQHQHAQLLQQQQQQQQQQQTMGMGMMQPATQQQQAQQLPQQQQLTQQQQQLPQQQQQQQASRPQTSNLQHQLQVMANGSVPSWPAT